MKWLSRIFAVAIVVVVVMNAGSAGAQAKIDPPTAPVLPPGITLAEFQGVSCLALGGISLVAAWGYAEVVLMAAVGGSSFALLAPIMATAFVAGCGVGSVMSPGLLWIYRRIE